MVSVDTTLKYGINPDLLPRKSPERWRYLYGPKIATVLDTVSYIPLSSVPLSTRRWIRTAADERAAQTMINGYPQFRYSEKLGQSVVDWIQTNCYLYEGSLAGHRMIVEDWQYEFFMQLFGWLQWHKTHGQYVRRFTHASGWIPKKNAKSPTLAATGLYVFCGEGEKGQKCYSLARDGEQAKISHMHAVNMVLQSPILSKECRVLKTTNEIRHMKTNSVFRIIHGKNAASQEGLNGSIFVDETHVVDRPLMEIVRRAGISRLQPLHVELSTVGDISNEYGRDRFEEGQKLVKCERDEDFNPHYLFINFGASPSLPPETFQDERKVLKLAIQSNPAIDRLFPREEIMNDWRQSRRSPFALSQYCRYRLGIWSSGGTAWLPPHAWPSCAFKGPLSIKRLKPYPCSIGVDLSSTRDTTSISLLFGVPRQNDPTDLVPHVLHYYWLPKSAVHRYRKFIDLEKFGRYLTVVNDEAIDQRVIADFIADLVFKDQLDIRCIAFDPYNSKIFLDHLMKMRGVPSTMLREIPTTVRTMSPATKDLESLILNNNLYHENNPVTNWQFSHCEVYADRLDNYMPCKPNTQGRKGGAGSDDPRKIDGVIALVNACAGSVDKDLGFRTIGSFSST